MDEMKISSDFTTNLISKLLSRIIRKKTGCDICIQLNKINTIILNGKLYAHIDLDAEVEKKELLKLIKNAD